MLTRFFFHLYKIIYTMSDFFTLLEILKIEDFHPQLVSMVRVSQAVLNMS